MYKNYNITLNYTWNDYNGLVWGQEANPVGNKSECTREGYALIKSPKGLKYKKQKKENWIFCKVYGENQKDLEKCSTSIVCVGYESDWQIDFLSTIKRLDCSLSPTPSAVLSTILPLAYLA